MPHSTPSSSHSKGLGRTISGYASGHPNEVVAEVFSGLAMGAPIADNVRTMYNAFGGPQPPDALVHVRTGSGWMKKNILYPVFHAVGIGTDP